MVDSPLGFKPPRNVIGSRVRMAREKGKQVMTQDQLAGRLAALGVPVDRVMIAKIETGRRCVYDFEVIAFSRALKVSPTWLLGIDSDLDGGHPGKEGHE